MPQLPPIGADVTHLNHLPPIGADTTSLNSDIKPIETNIAVPPAPKEPQAGFLSRSKDFGKGLLDMAALGFSPASAPLRPDVAKGILDPFKDILASGGNPDKLIAAGSKLAGYSPENISKDWNENNWGALAGDIALPTAMLWALKGPKGAGEVPGQKLLGAGSPHVIDGEIVSGGQRRLNAPPTDFIEGEVVGNKPQLQLGAASERLQLPARGETSNTSLSNRPVPEMQAGLDEIRTFDPRFYQGREGVVDASRNYPIDLTDFAKMNAKPEVLNLNEVMADPTNAKPKFTQGTLADSEIGELGNLPPTEVAERGTGLNPRFDKTFDLFQSPTLKSRFNNPQDRYPSVFTSPGMARASEAISPENFINLEHPEGGAIVEPPAKESGIPAFNKETLNPEESINFTDPIEGDIVSPYDPNKIDVINRAMGDRSQLRPGNVGLDIVGNAGPDKSLREAQVIPKNDKPIPKDAKGQPLTPLKPEEPGRLQRIYDLTRGLMSVDPPFMTSASFRQAGRFVGTKDWFKAWVPTAKAFGSKRLSDAIQASIEQRPLFQDGPNGTPSYAKQAGLKFGDLNKYSARDEAIRGELAERIPGYGKYVAASNRAFTTFLNSIAANRFEGIYNIAEKQGLNPKNNLVLGKEVAGFVNTALNRGKLGVELGNKNINLERHARALSNIFFSPRTMSSIVRTLNPSTYAMASPLVRRQYMGAMVRQIGLWWGLAEIASWGGAKVSHDPSSSDFGKIRMGNTRLDPPGGLQQFLVLGARQVKGGTTNTETDEFKQFGSGFRGDTRFSNAGQFLLNRLHPTLKTLVDFLNASKDVPFRVGDQALQKLLPMYADDLAAVLKTDPELSPIILGTSGVGIGTQSYERGTYGKPVFLDEDNDVKFEGGGVQ